MANETFLQKLNSLSPHIEMMVRRAYRNELLNRIISKSNYKNKSNRVKEVDFEKILSYLEGLGVKEGDILMLHSSFMPLMKCGLDRNQIVDKLISLVGLSGTLVMPVLRKYPESPPDEKILSADVSKTIFHYDVKKTKIWTGILPYTLMHKKGSVTSRFPINSLTAYGPEAKEMFKKELEGELPASNGINSAWNYCVNREAWVISLGIDLTHSLTMIHTAEDVKKEKWPIKNWYRKRKFIITDDGFKTTKTVLERHPKWGLLHYAERTLSKELIKENIITSKEVEGIVIESLKSDKLIDFLNRKNEVIPGYPYYWTKKYLKRN